LGRIRRQKKLEMLKDQVSRAGISMDVTFQPKIPQRKKRQNSINGSSSIEMCSAAAAVTGETSNMNLIG